MRCALRPAWTWQRSNLAATEVPLAGWRHYAGQKTSQMERYYAEAEAVLKQYQKSAVQNRALVWLLGKLLRHTGRGGKRFGSLTSRIVYGYGIGAWRCLYHFQI